MSPDHSKTCQSCYPTGTWEKQWLKTCPSLLTSSFNPLALLEARVPRSIHTANDTLCSDLGYVCVKPKIQRYGGTSYKLASPLNSKSYPYPDWQPLMIALIACVCCTSVIVCVYVPAYVCVSARVCVCKF